jgi:hypothetical protein
MFWAGGPLSWLRYMTLRSFRTLNPAWDMTLYVANSPQHSAHWNTGESSDAVTYRGRDWLPDVPALGVHVQQAPPQWLHNAKAPAQMCDVLQWSVLGQLSGFWSDIDILWVRPLDEVADYMQHAHAVLCNSSGYAAIGLLASAGDTETFNAISDTARANLDPQRYQSAGAEAIYRLAGVWPNWGVPGSGDLAVLLLRTKFPKEQIARLWDHAVYPFNHTEVDRIFTTRWTVKRHTYGIHWFGGNATAQKYNAILTKDNLRDHPSEMTRFLQDLA